MSQSEAIEKFLDDNSVLFFLQDIVLSWVFSSKLITLCVNFLLYTGTCDSSIRNMSQVRIGRFELFEEKCVNSYFKIA